MTHLLNRSFSEMFALILCFCCKISPALLFSCRWWTHEMNVCIFMTASLESGSAGQPPWRNDEMTIFWLSRKAAEIQSVVLRKASNEEESCCETDENPPSWLMGFSSLTLQTRMSFREGLCSPGKRKWRNFPKTLTLTKAYISFLLLPEQTTIHL